MKILHLYPNLMNLYGEYGNIAVLTRHLKDQGVEVKVDYRDIEDNINFKSYDLVYMGSGTEKNLMVALDNLYKYKSIIEEYIEAGKVLLFTGNAMELLGKSVNGKPGLGIIDFETTFVEKRYTGDAVVYNEEIGEVVGFINKSSIIKGGEANKLFTYKFKDNNLVDNDYEGYRYKNAFGTHLIGPVLAKNPNFIKTIICLLISDYKDIEYKYESESYRITLTELKHRK